MYPFSTPGWAFTFGPVILERQTISKRRLCPGPDLSVNHVSDISSLLFLSFILILVSELNLMVAGNSGLGKTSFIRTLYGTLKLRTSPGGLRNKASVSNLGSAATTSASGSGDITPENRPTSPNNNQNGIGTKANGTKDSAGYATGTLQRTLNSFEALFEIEENHEKINLTLVDTPGFVGTDDVIDAHCDEILAYLEYQFDLTLAEVIYFPFQIAFWMQPVSRYTGMESSNGKQKKNVILCMDMDGVDSGPSPFLPLWK
jgi:hypothetical protein